MELSSLNIKKAFLIFRETETPKKVLIFQKVELFYILGNGNPKKLLIFQEVTFRAQKMKKRLTPGPLFKPKLEK